jgi:hypothetical protein
LSFCCFLLLPPSSSSRPRGAPAIAPRDFIRMLLLLFLFQYRAFCEHKLISFCWFLVSFTFGLCTSCRSLLSSSSVSMKFMQNIALFLLHASTLPLVYGRVRFPSSGETSNEDAMVLMSAPHLNSNGDGSKNQRPMRLDQRHRHAQELNWFQVGGDIDGEDPEELFGTAVAMSADGSRVVVGAPAYNGTGYGTGKYGIVRVFQRMHDSWQQVGNDIVGEYSGDEFGASVDMSADGRRIVVGAPADYGDCERFLGYVRVFDEPVTGSADWTTYGDSIFGDVEGAAFGKSVAMSHNGRRIIVGAENGTDVVGVARVYDQPTNGTNPFASWIQIGKTINVRNCFLDCRDSFGISVDISASGSRIVVATPDNFEDDGMYNVRVFDEPTTDSDDWIQAGEPIYNGYVDNDPQQGWAVAISADGSRFVGSMLVWSEEYMGPREYRGAALVFEQIDNFEWEKVGNTVYFEATNDTCCQSVAISADGTRIAVGVVDGNEVRVFDQPTGDSSDWVQIGNGINGEAGGDQFGKSLAMSADGKTVAVGAPLNDGNVVNSDVGNVRVFAYTISVEEPECPICALVHCDFATLAVASYLSNAPQQQRLLEACDIISMTANKNGVSRNVNVFNSSNIRSTNARDDPDLGSPNRNCPVKGPGIGIGGGGNATYPNCIPQGNLLIIQDTGTPESRPNDSADGGCINIKFQNVDGVSLFDMGLLDVEEPRLNITVRVLLRCVGCFHSFSHCRGSSLTLLSAH